MRASFGRRGRLWVAGTLVLGAVALVACDGLLEVESDPQTVDATQPASLQATIVGATADFYQSFDSFVVWSGLLNDEFVNSGTAPGIQAWDRRDVPSACCGGVGRGNSIGGGNYGLLQRAAALSDIARDRIRNGEFDEIEAPGTDTPEYALFTMYSAFAKTWVGDLWCSTAFGGVGPELATADVYAIAEEQFTEVIEAAGAAANVREAARVGRARVRLYQGNDAGALADAEQVDPDFEIFTTYSTATFEQRNRIHFRVWDFSNWSVGPSFRDLEIDDTGMPDPRVELVLDPTPAFEPSQPLYAPLKVPSAATPLRFASGDEARYIIAEIQGGQEAVDIINEVRARHGIPQQWQPQGGDPDEILLKVLDERKRTLFLEGVRQADLRRYIERYDLDLWPTSVPQGFPMGNQVCIPLPDVERFNNPDL